MNLNAIVGPIIAAINPPITVTIQQSNGYTETPDGRQVPVYLAPVQVQAQLQSLTYSDLSMLDGLNIQGERRALYLNGDWEGVVRPDAKGGDVIILPNGSTWLVVQVLENWAFQDGWVKVAITRQNDT